jgi:hypothetical protein
MMVDDHQIQINWYKILKMMIFNNEIQIKSSRAKQRNDKINVELDVFGFSCTVLKNENKKPEILVWFNF